MKGKDNEKKDLRFLMPKRHVCRSKRRIIQKKRRKMAAVGLAVNFYWPWE